MTGGRYRRLAWLNSTVSISIVRWWNEAARGWT
jgi:hypothetical protein